MRKLEEKFRENTTLKYYNENAIIFSARPTPEIAYI